MKLLLRLITAALILGAASSLKAVQPINVQISGDGQKLLQQDFVVGPGRVVTVASGGQLLIVPAGILDLVGTARGSILFKGASGTTALPPGPSGYVLTSQGTGADPIYTPSGGGSGSVWGGITGTLSNQTDLATALGLKAAIDSQTFTGVPRAPTATVGTNTTQIATTAFVIANAGGGGSPAWGAITGTLSNQTDLNTALGLKATIASPTFTGTPAGPTATVGTNTTQLATTAFVLANAGSGSGNVSNSGTPTAGQTAIWTDATHVQGLSFAHFTGSFDGGGSVLTAATATPKVMTYAGTIHGWYLRSDISGTVTVDVQKATAGGSFTSITASATPSLSSAAYATSTTLTSWATAFAVGDSLRAVITGTPSTATQVTVVIY